MKQRGKNSSGTGKRSRNEAGKDSEDAIDNSEFSNLICGSEKVPVIDVSRPRVSLVGVDLREILSPMDDWKCCE